MRPTKNSRRMVLAVGALIGLMFAHGASALVTVNATSTADGMTLSVGATFDVDVSVTWDGSSTGPGDTLTGIFTSHTWNSVQLMLINADSTLGAPGMFETRPNILAGTSFQATMGRFGTIASGVAGDDLDSSARTVQYGVVTPVEAARATTDLVVRLTFQILAAGDGVAEIAGANLLGDTGANGDSFAFGTGVAITVPEPTSTMLALSAIGSVFAVVSIRRRD